MHSTPITTAQLVEADGAVWLDGAASCRECAEISGGELGVTGSFPWTNESEASGVFFFLSVLIHTEFVFRLPDDKIAV